MPLIQGKGKAAISDNIKLLVNEWKHSGTIGTSSPRNKKKAVKQAVAIALSTAGRSRSKRPSKGEK